MPTPFPYLVIATPRDATRPPASDQVHRLRGYRGWKPPRHTRIKRAQVPLPPLVPRSEWTARIAAAAGKSLKDLYPLPAKDQNGLGYCWVYGSTRAVEIERVRTGLTQLEFCPESLGGPLTNWQNEGGYASEAFAGLETAGIAESKLCPFPHHLNPRTWDRLWKDNALSHETATWTEISPDDRSPDFDEIVTALLDNRPVAAGLSWWGHLVCFLQPILLPPETNCQVNTPDGAKVGILFQNSWGPDWPTTAANGYACLVESLATPDGAAVPILVH